MRRVVAILALALTLGLSTEAQAGLGDNEVCLPAGFLGRIETGGAYEVGDTLTQGLFTIEVTSVNDEGEITGFQVTGGAYGFLVIHAGGGQDTFSDPAGPFDHGLSFVAFCGEQDPTPTPTETATEEPTATPTDEPTMTPTREVITDCKDPDTGQYIECPTSTPTEEPTGTPVVTPDPTGTNTPVVPQTTPTTDLEPPLTVVQMPDTGAGSLSGETKGRMLLLGMISLAVLAVGYSLKVRNP